MTKCTSTSRNLRGGADIVTERNDKMLKHSLQESIPTTVPQLISALNETFSTQLRDVVQIPFCCNAEIAEHDFQPASPNPDCRKSPTHSEGSKAHLLSFRWLKEPVKSAASLVGRLRSFKDMRDADDFFERFHAQAEAFACADARPGLGMRVFAADKDGSGAKHYVVATYRSFWKRYRRWDPAERHFAEVAPPRRAPPDPPSHLQSRGPQVIRDGAACRLYLDMEFAIAAGEDVERIAARLAALA